MALPSPLPGWPQPGPGAQPRASAWAQLAAGGARGGCFAVPRLQPGLVQSSAACRGLPAPTSPAAARMDVEQGWRRAWRTEAFPAECLCPPLLLRCPRAAKTVRPSPPSPAQPKFPSGRRPLGSSGIVPYTNDKEGTWRGRGAAALPCCAPAAAFITVPEPCSVRPAPLLHALRCRTLPPALQPPRPTLPARGLRASPSARAALCGVAPRDQRTGIAVTVMYNK